MSGQPISTTGKDGAPPANRLIAWYDRARRDLPWRAPPGRRPNPYAVWLSEIMLQQTAAKTVGPYFRRFLVRWPTVGALAAAPLDEVMKAWAGLGYYARARNLHACAKAVCRDHAGRFPDDMDTLRALPGIGAYTAAAIAAIAFDAQRVPVDGNIRRVMARYHAVRGPLRPGDPEIEAHAQALLPSPRPGDLVQALMDLGATVCTPKRPICAICPLSGDCKGLAQGIAENLPEKAPKTARPVRRAAAFFAERQDGHVLVRRRPDRGLLGGMTEFPTGNWVLAGTMPPSAAEAPLAAEWRKVPGHVRHVFTHFVAEIEVWRAEVAEVAEVEGDAAPERCRWVAKSALFEEALPSLMRKVARHALAGRPKD
ncbi:MAG: A/G-specific adenine glycosylase [Hyphomicrobiales bacterium]|nr:A/G-specific adenine glycosylase [Hyphomicrobiales bacterium]